jgi:hypothetical protein
MSRAPICPQPVSILVRIAFDRELMPAPLEIRTVAIAKNSKYSDLDRQLNNLIDGFNGGLKVLEQCFGPWPYWRYPNETKIVPHTIRKIHLVDSNKAFTIALLRTEDDDRPLILGNAIHRICILKYSDINPRNRDDTLNHNITAIDALKSATSKAGFTLKEAKVHKTLEDIGDRKYNDTYFLDSSRFPTIFIVISTHCKCKYHVVWPKSLIQIMNIQPSQHLW